VPGARRVVLKHVSLEVREVERTKAFHDRFLGSLGLRRFVDDKEYIGYTNGAFTLWFLEGRPSRVKRHPIGGDEEVVAEHLAFEVGSAEEVRTVQSELEGKELYPTFRAEEHPEFTAGYFSATWVDPDEIVLEVYAVDPGSAARPRKVARRKSASTKRRAK
jgi:catechol 2,3-dioxygenase-like lactoylglutathione lyase family enzyme